MNSSPLPLHSVLIDAEQGFPKTYRIKRRVDFVRVKQHGYRMVSQHFVFYLLANGLTLSRLGLIVPKKVGHSPSRNHVKRLLREAFRIHRTSFPIGLDLVILAKSEASELGYSAVVVEVSTCAAWAYKRGIPR